MWLSRQTSPCRSDVIEKYFGRNEFVDLNRNIGRRIEMLRYERGKRPVVKGTQPVIARHDLAGVLTRFHIDEVLAVGEKAPHLHFVQKLAE